MSLFAPMENQSERGSQRALSPDFDDDEEYEAPGETPRPNRAEASKQSLPTARASTGPTTLVKTRDMEGPLGFVTVKLVKDLLDAEVAGGGSTQGSDGGAHSIASSHARGRKLSMSPRKIKHTLSARGDRRRDRTLLAQPYRRTKSLSQLNIPLSNSANPPTVRDDLFEIHRTNQIEDSTLDDLADLLESKDNVQGPAYSAIVVPKVGSRNEIKDGENEIEVYKRMSESLKTGLLGIRTAKQGIERLETSVFHADAKNLDQHNGDASSVCSACQDDSPSGHNKVTYVHLPLPQLYQRQPTFKFTLFGLILFLVSLWYIGESTMCSMYCKPQYCYPGKPCNWSPDDPVWGYSIPVKLDQWVAGGRGKAFANQATLDITDWMADMWDAATGVDITKVDTSHYSWEQKRQHRRRLVNKGLIRPSRERKRGKTRRVS